MEEGDGGPGQRASGQRAGELGRERWSSGQKRVNLMLDFRRSFINVCLWGQEKGCLGNLELQGLSIALRLKERHRSEHVNGA